MTLPPTLDELSAKVEAELTDFMAGREMPLYRMMAYHLGWEDQTGGRLAPVARMRAYGVACLLASAAARGDSETALPAAAAVELAHSFTQIHDDVQGANTKRDDRDSVWWVWGPAQAINAGDGMHAMARLALFRLLDRGVSQSVTFRAVQLLDEASLKLCEGRFQDLEAQERIDLSVDAYLDMAGKKSGAPLGGAMRLGAVVSGATEPVVDGLGRCGSRLGVAAQVRNDVRQLWPADPSGDTPPSSNILDKKKLLPVVYAFEKAPISEKRKLGDIYFKRVLDPGDVGEIRRVVEGLGAREYCDELVETNRAEALQAARASDVSESGLEIVSRFADTLLA